MAEDSSGTGQVETNETENLTEGREAGSGKPHAQGNPIKEATSKQDEIFEIKVNGRIQKLSRTEVMNLASMSHVAQSKFDEAASIRKDTERLRELAKKDPMSALLDPSLGLDKSQIREALEEFYNREYIEPEELTPDQKRTKELEARIKKFEDQENESKQKKQQEEESAQEKEERNYLQTKIISALEASNLPKTPYYASRMAFYMGKNMENGWDAPDEIIIQQVRGEFQSVLGQITSQPIEEVIKLLPPELLNKLRQYDLSQLRESRNKKGGFLSSVQIGEEKPVKNERVYSSDVTERMRRIQREGF